MSKLASRFGVGLLCAVALGVGTAASSGMAVTGGGGCNNVKCSGDTCTGTGGLGFECSQGWVSGEQGCQSEFETGEPCCIGVGCTQD